MATFSSLDQQKSTCVDFFLKFSFGTVLWHNMAMIISQDKVGDFTLIFWKQIT